jgi:hypothetical protein
MGVLLTMGNGLYFPTVDALVLINETAEIALINPLIPQSWGTF